MDLTDCGIVARELRLMVECDRAIFAQCSDAVDVEVAWAVRWPVANRVAPVNMELDGTIHGWTL